MGVDFDMLDQMATLNELENMEIEEIESHPQKFDENTGFFLESLLKREGDPIISPP